MYTHTHTYSTVPTYHDDVAHGLPFWSWSWRKARDAKAARIRPRRMHPVVAPAHLATQGRCCQSLYPYTYTHARRACSFVCLLFVCARERVVRVLFRVASRGGLLFSVPRWRTRFTVQCLAQRGCATGTFAYICTSTRLYATVPRRARCGIYSVRTLRSGGGCNKTSRKRKRVAWAWPGMYAPRFPQTKKKKKE